VRLVAPPKAPFFLEKYIIIGIFVMGIFLSSMAYFVSGIFYHWQKVIHFILSLYRAGKVELERAPGRFVQERGATETRANFS
jgi:hypothetical protein